jgi:hypothetical protein
LNNVLCKGKAEKIRGVLEISANCSLQAHTYFKNAQLQRCYLTQKCLFFGFFENYGYTSKPFKFYFFQKPWFRFQN